MPPYDCNQCYDRGAYADYRDGRKGRLTDCDCVAATS